nr:MAG TPA_asm: hypothetical protein [Caudoviricetes sp.]
MAKFVGVIGLIQTVEESPGYFGPTPREISCKGDLLKSSSKRDNNSDSTNDDITISNRISIFANPYSKEHIFEMAYLKFKFPKMGGTWKITNAEVDGSRIILTLGGVYSGITVDTKEKVTGYSR